MNDPLVSVVIPIYNVEEYLDRCIDSIVGQTYRNLEIILVDDGSPDSCPAMCDEWAKRDGRIRVIHKENAGLGMARNSGLEAASGKYICFFDSDDYVDITTVEKCVGSAEEHGADAVIFGRWDVYDDGRIEKKPIAGDRCIFRGEEIREVLLPGMFTYDRGFGISSCGRMFRRQAFFDYGLRFRSEREIVSEDAYFALEFYGKACIVTVVPENFYYYYKRSTSLSRVYRKDRQEKNDAFLVKSLECAVRYELPAAAVTCLKVRYHYYTIAALEQVMVSDMTSTEKKDTVWGIFRSPVLRRTLSMDVLRAERKRTLQLFFLLLKFRCHGLCYLLLKYKMRNT